jgi:hypothetical protein
MRPRVVTAAQRTHGVLGLQAPWPNLPFAVSPSSPDFVQRALQGP